ncbi:MAG: hypothetical protein B193_1982 [Solidesulfovibrio magneticus str. Maddingley MBC34]|uniref:Uncharacterized protein n=1 Tax=Solidesulfovibrio magneticus str. Maddingley MBC34 TaxID=1206767 RepID=K6GQS0_9BACT|nr:MAG: hypothetical protein B193_1982 [Solidesulfovibrio magneticus str. Maddingley MBC34]
MSAASDPGPDTVVRITGSGRVVSEAYRPPTSWQRFAKRLARRLAPPFPPAEAARIALWAMVRGYAVIVGLGMLINCFVDGFAAGVATLWRQWDTHFFTASATTIPIVLNEDIKSRIIRHRELSPTVYFFSVVVGSIFLSQLAQGQFTIVRPLFFAALPTVLYLVFPNRG